MISECQQLLLLFGFALQQALEQEALNLQRAFVLLPSLPCALLLSCNLRSS